MQCDATHASGAMYGATYAFTFPAVYNFTQMGSIEM